MESSPSPSPSPTPAPAPGAMQVAGASSSRPRDPRLLGVSFDLPASWGYRKPMAFCKDLDALASASGSAAAKGGAAGEPRPNNGSSRSPLKGVAAAQQADEGAAVQESPRLQSYLLRDRRAGRDSAEDAREHKMVRNMDGGVVGVGVGGSGKRFSLQLTNQEIEADFVAMTGRKPPRRPRRISKSAQRQLEPLFPGNLLSGVNHERYKVNEKGGF